MRTGNMFQQRKIIYYTNSIITIADSELARSLKMYVLVKRFLKAGELCIDLITVT